MVALTWLILGAILYIKVQGRKKCGTPSLFGVGGLQSFLYQNSASLSTCGSTTGYSSMFRFPLFLHFLTYTVICSAIFKFLIENELHVNYLKK